MLAKHKVGSSTLLTRSTFPLSYLSAIPRGKRRRFDHKVTARQSRKKRRGRAILPLALLLAWRDYTTRQRIDDAIKDAMGVRIRDLPTTAEKVHAAMREKE